MNFQFSPTQTIAMETEVLDISPGKIQVDFLFRNLGTKAEEIDIAFPFAPHRFYDSVGSCSGEPRGAPKAKLSVDGKEALFKWEYKFALDGKPLTPAWNALLLKVRPDPGGCGGGKETWKGTLKNLIDKPDLKSTEGYKDFVQLADLYRKSFGRSDIEHLDDLRVQEFLTWKHRFPPGQGIKVTHTFQDPSGFGGLDSSYEKDACLAEAPTQTIWRRVQGNGLVNPAHDKAHCQPDPQFVRYILKTGAGWAKPIKKFTLVLRKASKDSFISTCFSGLRKISDLEFRAERENYLPAEDLAVVWLDDHCW